MIVERHVGKHANCPECHVFNRRVIILRRALHHPEGLTPYEFTKGMTKDDSLQFWVDAKFLQMVGVGKSHRGTRLFASPSYAVPA